MDILVFQTQVPPAWGKSRQETSAEVEKLEDDLHMPRCVYLFYIYSHNIKYIKFSVSFISLVAIINRIQIYSYYISVITKTGNILDKIVQGSKLRWGIEFKVILRTIFHADFYRYFLICHSKTSHKVATSIIPSFKKQENRHKRDSVICPVSHSDRRQVSFQMQTILPDSWCLAEPIGDLFPPSLLTWMCQHFEEININSI